MGQTSWRGRERCPTTFLGLSTTTPSGRDSGAKKGETRRYSLVVVLCLFILTHQRNWAVSKSEQAPFPSPFPEVGVFWL